MNESPSERATTDAQIRQHPAFTPGPWVARPDGDPVSNDLWCIVSQEQEEYLATIVDTMPLDRARADAHLMAAAPDLYEAAEAVLEGLIGMEPMTVPTMVIKLRAALKKARGEA